MSAERRSIHQNTFYLILYKTKKHKKKTENINVIVQTKLDYILCFNMRKFIELHGMVCMLKQCADPSRQNEKFL